MVKRRMIIVVGIVFLFSVLEVAVGFPSTVVDQSKRCRVINVDDGYSVKGFFDIQRIPTIVASGVLALVVATSDPTISNAASNKMAVPTTSTTAARIHLKSLPPSTVEVQIGDLPFIGPLVSGTYSKADDESLVLKKMLKKNSNKNVDLPVVINSPTDKTRAIRNIAQRGHLEFDIDGPILQTHLDVDVAASEAGIATIKVTSPIIPRLPFKNKASNLVPPAATTLKKVRQQTPNKKRMSSGTDAAMTTSSSSTTAAQIYLNSLPPGAISVEIEDLFLLGRLLSGVYTKVDDLAVVVDNKAQATVDTSSSLSTTTSAAAAVTIESPQDKVAAIKAIASRGHLEFDIDGIINTHLDVDIATDTVGSATIRVASPTIPPLPFKNTASF